MANTIKTIEIATLLKAALDAVVPSGTAVYARGVMTDKDGTADSNVTKAERQAPCVDIITIEREPFHYNSVLQTFPVRIRACTIAADDPFQVALYTLAQPVSDWLTTPGTLALTLVEFDALVVDGAPDINGEGQLQFFEWTISIKTRDA